MFFFVNVPFEKHEVEDYERKRYRGWDQRLVHSREERILGNILKIIGDCPQLFLDAPCGYGRFTDLLLAENAAVVSSDLSFHMVRRARERSSGPRFPLGAVADIKRGLPFRDGAFEAVLSMRFFHHLHRMEDRMAVLAEFRRVTAGWVILSFYRMNALHSIQRKLRRTVKKSRTQIKMISRREFTNEVRDAGLRTVRIFPLFRGIHAHHIALLRKD